MVYDLSLPVVTTAISIIPRTRQNPHGLVTVPAYPSCLKNWPSSECGSGSGSGGDDG